MIQFYEVAIEKNINQFSKYRLGDVIGYYYKTMPTLCLINMLFRYSEDLALFRLSTDLEFAEFELDELSFENLEKNFIFYS
jgi:hypothetical protein